MDLATDSARGDTSQTVEMACKVALISKSHCRRDLRQRQLRVAKHQLRASQPPYRYSPLGLHMTRTPFSTARTQGTARARYVDTPCENSRLSDDLDAIVKSLALNSCKDNSSF